MKWSFKKLLLTCTGVLGILFSSTYDLFGTATTGFGRKQFIGFTVSLLILLTGLKNTFPSRKRPLNIAMLCIYLLGLFYLVLRPNPYYLDYSKGLLQTAAFSPFDFCVNILGFSPLGYLLLSLLNRDKRKRPGRYLIVALSSLFLSLLIELAQFHIEGRTSSLYDILANGMGGLLGAWYYHVEARLLATKPGKDKNRNARSPASPR